MAKIDSFATEKWIALWTGKAKYDLASTCSHPLSIQELTALSEDKSSSSDNGPLSSALLSKPLTYGEMNGSTKLRSTIANLYSVKTPSPLPAENVLITPGASSANYLVFQALCGPDDHVIVQYPTFQQLYSVPRSIGAEVSFWRAKENDKWQLDLDELKAMIKPNTKMIVLNNPQNPTGAIIPRSMLEDVINVAKEHSITILSDEIYRPLFHSISPMDEDFPPSALSLGYDNVITTGSMSKAYSLPGIRVGWIASRNKAFIDECRNYRSYTTIAVSQLDDEVAAFALSGNCLHRLISRNIVLAKHNIQLLESFIDQHRWACDWVRPVASSVAFIKFSKMGKPVDDFALCTQLLEKKGVLLTPGCHCFGDDVEFKGYVRFGFITATEDLEAGLKALREFMEEEYENVPVAGKTVALR